MILQQKRPLSEKRKMPGVQQAAEQGGHCNYT
jgi:hypothetical protein